MGLCWDWIGFGLSLDSPWVGRGQSWGCRQPGNHARPRPAHGPQSHTHRHTYIHTHIQTHIHTHTHTYTHTNIHTYTCAHTYRHTCTHIHTYAHVHTYTYTHVHDGFRHGTSFLFFLFFFFRKHIRPGQALGICLGTRGTPPQYFVAHGLVHGGGGAHGLAQGRCRQNE